MSNNVKYYFKGSLWAVMMLFVSGGIIQTFFAEIGFSTRQIAAYTSMISVVQVIVMVSSLFMADNIQNVKNTYATIMLSPILVCVAMLLPCFFPEMNADTVFYIAIIVCCVQNFFLGFGNVLAYRLPYLIIDMKEYSSLENTNAIYSGIFSIIVSSLITFLSTIFPFRQIMTVGFIMSILFCIASSFLVRSMKVRKEYQTAPKQEKFSLIKLKKREFRYFYIPNFLRGCAMGLMNIIAVICMKEVSTNASVISALATIYSVACITGSSIYQMFRKKINTVSIYAGSSLLMCLLLPIMLIGQSVPVFCITYFLVCIFYNAINIAGAVYPTEFIGYLDMGTYTSVRLIIMTLGQAFASYTISYAIDYIPTILVVALCGAAQLISGIMYYLFEQKRPKA